MILRFSLFGGEGFLSLRDFSYLPDVLTKGVIVSEAVSQSPIGPTPQNNVINGTDGDDTLNGTELADTINGGEGVDQISGADGNDTINGGEDRDFISGDDGDDMLFGDGGDDIINGGFGDDVIEGGEGNDQLSSQEGNNIIRGGAGEDNISDGFGNDQLFGGDDDDSLRSNHGSDFINAGAGDDYIDIRRSFDSGTITIEAGSGDDMVDAGGSFSHEDRNLNHDIDLGSGQDTLNITNLIGGSFVVTLGEGADRVRFFNAEDIAQNLAAGPIRITDFELGDGGDVLQINALIQAYVTNGGDGADWVDTGDDMVLRFSTASTGEAFDVVVLENIQFDQLPDANSDTGMAQEATNFLGTRGDDRFIGSNFNDTFTDGGGGNDVFVGNDGDDQFGIQRFGGSNNTVVVDAGAGNDRLSIDASVGGLFTIDMGEGDDFVGLFRDPSFTTAITLGAGSDTIRQSSTAVATVLDFETGDGGDIFDLNITQSSVNSNGDPFGSGELTLTQEGNDTVLRRMSQFTDAIVTTLAVFQNTNADDFTAFNFGGIINPDAARPGVTFNGPGASETFTGTIGRDTINGLEGVDTLDGGDGADMIDGGDQNDTITGGFGDDIIRGGSGNDTINETFGSNMIFGDLGDDTVNITGYFGSSFSNAPDQIFGGKGNDTVNFTRSSSNSLIVDLGDGFDRIVFNNQPLFNQITLGAGPDVVDINPLGSRTYLPSRALVITDFRAGDGGDKLDWEIWVRAQTNNQTTPNWNPFAFNETRLRQVGDDVHLEWTIREINNGSTLVIFQNTRVADFTTANFGFDPQAPLADGDNFSGTSGDDTYNGTNLADTASGLGGNDTLNGRAGDDDLDGGPGNDRIHGNEGDDTLAGGADDDIINGGTGADTIFGGSGNDTINAGPGDGEIDIIDAGNGDDVIQFSGSNDTYIGGSGNDTLDLTAGFRGFNEAIDVDLTDFLTSGTFRIGGQLVTDIENVRYRGDTSEFDDRVIFGAAYTNGQTIRSGAGNDDITATSGSDTLDGQEGDDTLNGLGGDDFINDLLGNNTIDGGDGRDFIDTGDGNDTILGGDGNDQIASGNGDDVIDGGDGNDFIRSDNGVNQIDAGAGDDNIFLTAFEAGSTVDGGEGDDGLVVETGFNSNGVDVDFSAPGASPITNVERLRFTLGNDADNRLIFGEGYSDTVNITSGDGADIITGGSGDDTINGGGGDNVISGGSGNDTLSGDGTVDGGEGDDTVSGSGLVFGGAGNDSVRGSGTLRGGDGVDNFRTSGDGATILLEAGLTQERFNGRDGQMDVIQPTADGSRLLWVTAIVQNPSIGREELVERIEIVSDGGFADFGITGSGINDEIFLSGGFGVSDVTLQGFVPIYGLGGNDRIRGSLSDDTIFGGDGNDTLISSEGSDTLHGGAGDDRYEIAAGSNHTLRENADEGDDIVVSFIDVEIGDHIERLELRGEARIATGGNTANVIVGTAGDNELYGRGGDDRLIGGDGNDLLDGGDGSDFADYSQSFNPVEIDLRITGPQNTSTAGTDTLINIENVLGSNGNDTIIGNDGANILRGGFGDDVLNGGGNIDVALYSGIAGSYGFFQDESGVFRIIGPDGEDRLVGIEFAVFEDLIVRLLPGTGVSVDFETSDPSVYQAAMNNIRDFDGNVLGGNGSWLRIGATDVNGDGDVDQILVNDAIGRFATVGTAPDGLIYFDDHGWAGETRVAGTYIDPLVQSGAVEQGSPNDSQVRFQNDLEIENINRVLGSDDYDGDGIHEVYFALTDGTAYLRALMHDDGNIRYANYQSEQEVRDYLTANGFGEETFGDWFGGSTGVTGSEAVTAMHASELIYAPNDMVQAEFFG